MTPYIDITQPRGLMKTVAELIEDLKKFPPDAFAAAYSAEATGIIIYPTSFGTYGIWDRRSNDADQPIGFIELYYSNCPERRPMEDDGDSKDH